ncbi:hypothetical protein G3N57_26530 [Paraburkholderia sp. Se-20369]|nr:hypothetical protein [Paraburkholderia sp. Se-20369]TCW83003.1 hypothetical protein C5O80_18110 [Burkholderia sp. SRS-46]
MKRFISSISLAATIALALSACASQATSPAPQIVGGDRDAHGCIGSAGYAWCESTGQCERPWELAKQKGFANSAEGFAQFCRGAAAK